MTRVFLGLGSNLAERTDHLRAALGSLLRAPRAEVVGLSKIYETRAVEVSEEQPDYLNCVAEITCDLAAEELLRLCQGIEVALGRDRGEAVEKAPRTVDIDLLLFGTETVEGRDFRVPHRGVSRAYNLVALADIDPSIRIPGLGAVGDLLAGVYLGGIREYDDGAKAVPAALGDGFRVVGRARRTDCLAAGYQKTAGGQG